MYLMKVFFPVTLYSILLTWVFAHEGEASKPFQMLHLHDAIDIHAHGGWESLYALEGRDSLDGGSLWSSSVEASYDHFLEVYGMVVPPVMIFASFTLEWE